MIFGLFIPADKIFTLNIFIVFALMMIFFSVSTVDWAPLTSPDRFNFTPELKPQTVLLLFEHLSEVQ